MDLSFLAYYADNPVAFVVLVIGAVVIIYTWKVLPLKIEKMWIGKAAGEERGEAGQKTESIKKDGIIPHLDKTLERMESKIDEANGSMRDMETRINHIDKAAMMGIIYNRNIHIIDRLRAFICYLKLGGNGLVAEFAIEYLVGPNRDLWMRAVQESQMIPRCPKYEERIAEINKKIA